MKIAIFEIEPWEHSAFEALEKDHEVVYYEKPLEAAIDRCTLRRSWY